MQQKQKTTTADDSIVPSILPDLQQQAAGQQ